ncbi:restriction endonuclease subunit S [Dolichospermum circinale CS-534/05]|uniref:restriction endonuclease subunit S n=1 Tax=Dolichospermum circinale TaxID=109265 RepID=UPI00232DC551|nr:restriction endonuclease subunit S [Dolichospermum circinale]MDB9453067.1 restriction endonuclease subunit S [Dolichospermum circinale CS-541/06]MDB9463047.1 restriction endonuclease subunit S [Dolichospermum circinale CS-541/04]MDB9489073.1 restriction endonuclease subunit S [Dolichospermum circinale CS-534/05]MDB9546130.1 restriction endonuclease subunit S [Dolichospermum circinale CS-1031]
MNNNWCPLGWKQVKLEDLGEVNRGRSRYRPRYAEHLYGGKYPFIQTGDIKSSNGKITTYQQTYSEAGLAQSRLWPCGTMCITIAANIAETAILTFPACFPDSVVGFIADNSKCDVFFVEYMFHYLKARIQREATGSVQDNINLATLNRLYFPLPPLSEQKAIAHILSSLDDKIELNRQMNETLEAMARAIFKSWFVDFDPVSAKRSGRQPAGMDAATANLFPDEFEESSLGLIPKGWRVSTIGESVKIVGGSTPSTKNPDYWEGGTIHWTTPKDLSSLSTPVLLNTERKITELGLKQISSGLLPKGTLLLSSRAPIGYLAISEIPVAINQGYIGMICDKGLPNYYILNWTRENIATIIGRANGTTFLEISKSNFRPIELVIPDIKILDVFIKQVERLYQMIVNNLQESHTLATLRDTLLPKLMSGEIGVKEAEKIINDKL